MYIQNPQTPGNTTAPPLVAMLSLRLRRALSLSSSILNHHNPLSSSIPALHAPPQISLSHSYQNPNELDLLNLPFQSKAFRSSSISLSSRPRTSSYNNEDNKISQDEILFEGCDYNHWLIVMDFPKDPKPSPEEMIETYVQTAAKVLGSVEEAKKKIYACSTTTYNGFQVEVSEEMSEKFNGLPGVVFVLPDSYIDPVNKEYGGDKYINGTIIPRPPPIQSPRHTGRHNDRKRDFNQPRGSYQQGSSTYYNQGPRQGDARNFRAPQNPSPQQNYGPPRVGERRDPMPVNNSSGGWNNYQGDRRDPMPSYQGNYNEGQRGNSYPQGKIDFTPGAQKNYAPPEQSDFRVDNRDYAPTQGGSLGPGSGGNYGQRTGWNYGQGKGGNYGQEAGGNYRQGAIGDYGKGAGGNYGQVAGGNHGQGVGGNYGQGTAGSYGHGVGGGGPGQELSPNYWPSYYSGQGGNQNLSQGLQMNNMQQGAAKKL